MNDQRITIKEKHTAVLMTCYNRCNVTLRSLEALYNCSLPDGFEFDIFLVDDNSPDKTGEIVKYRYPKVNIIQGTGSLYWNRGMRLAWKIAASKGNYDFYLWLNDDTLVNKDALNIIFSDYYNNLKAKKKDSIISGVCSYHDSTLVSYGGRDVKFKFVNPNGMPQKCMYINGNITLIPKRVFDRIGNLSNIYSHSIGDFDYGLRALEAGFECYVTSKYVANCDRNPNPEWLNVNAPLYARWKSFKSPIAGYNVKEYFYFHRNHRGLMYACYSYFYIHLKVLFPFISNWKNTNK